MPLTRRTPLRSTTTLKPGSALAKEGRRGRRLRTPDAKARASAKEHPCICGCSAEWKDWAHLDGRSEDVRLAEHLSVPACRPFHGWLDRTVKGVKARKILRGMAMEKLERLTVDECRAVILGFGYLDWRERSGWGGS